MYPGLLVTLRFKKLNDPGFMSWWGQGVYQTRVTTGERALYTGQFLGFVPDDDPFIIISCPHDSLYVYILHPEMIGWLMRPALSDALRLECSPT